MKDLGYGEEYKYAHEYTNNFVAAEFLPEEITGTTFYSPGKNPRENAIGEFLRNRWKGKYELWSSKLEARSSKINFEKSNNLRPFRI